MILSLVSVTNQNVTALGAVAPEGFTLDLTNNISPQPYPRDSQVPRVKEYCQKLKGILDKNKESGVGTLSAHVDWAPSHRKKVYLRLQGKLLENLQKCCGKNSELCVDGIFTNYGRTFSYGNRQLNYSTGNMKICLPSSLNVIPKPKKSSQKGKRQTNSECSSSTAPAPNNDAYCEDKDVPMTDEFWANLTQLENLTITLHVRVFVGDEYLHKGSDLNRLEMICKSIQMDQIHSDVSIVAVDGSVFQANKCFLVAHSPVFKKNIESNFKESRTNQIDSGFSANCVKSLLDYFYTLDIPDAVECSKLAVELFQAADFYEIRHLEEMLVEIFLQRGNSWYDVHAAIDLFRFVRKIGTGSGIELKSKVVQVLQSKYDQLTNSENFKKLFAEDWEAAMELCAMALKKQAT